MTNYTNKYENVEPFNKISDKTDTCNKVAEEVFWYKNT